MTERELIDFDAFRAEQQHETIPLKVGGVVYQVPASPPAAAVFDSLRRRRDGRTTVDPDGVFALAQGILGEAAEAIIRTAGLSLPDLMALTQMVAEQQSNLATPRPNRRARRARPARTPSTSSSPGHSSKRTSSANMVSISGSLSPT